MSLATGTDPLGPSVDSPPTAAAFSVVIPAHNEEAVLGRCLDALLADASSARFEIIVAANGCTDRTVEIAKAYGPAVTVVEVAEASKHAALNAADAAATAFPRAYLDADIVLGGAAIEAVVDAMRSSGALVGAPQPRIDLTGCPPVVRSFYRVWTRLPWFTDNPVGSGVYVLSQEGHRRLGAFPDITNDDQYVHDLFRADERICVRSHSFTIRPPRTVEGLTSRRTRTIHGQRELAERFGTLPGAAPRASATDLVRARPGLVVDLPVFVAVTRWAARGAARKTAANDTTWERDDTSRLAPAPPAGGPAKPVPTTLRRLGRGARSVVDLRTWLHTLRIAHFYGYSHVREKRLMTIGADPSFSPTASLCNGERITLGDRVHVGERVCLWAGDTIGRITIGDDVLLGPAVVVTASDYGLVRGTPPAFQPKVERDVVIESGAWLGANVVVVAGVTIHHGAIVGAGSVVTRDLPADTICAGNPARPLKPRPASPEAAP